jgi:hypothetical protein
MPEEYIGKREFDGFGNTVREGFNRLQENMTQVSVKLDTLVNGRVEEARVIGEISGKISAIIERLERQERETDALKKAQEAEAASFREQISDLKDRHVRESDGKVNWFMQIVALIVSAITGGFIMKNWK